MNSWLKTLPAALLGLIVTVQPIGARAEGGLVQPFEIDVPDAVLADLSDRLRRARWPDQIPGSGWDYGADMSALRRLATYWAETYNWRAHEAALNEFDQYTTEIDGQTIHFIHQRSPDPNARPLLLLHGWPGSIAEFRKIIGPLTDPAAHGAPGAPSFHVIAPSLPGFGFSGPTTDRGWSPQRMAEAFLVLMDRLGYDRFAAQGGDWGSIIAQWMARKSPERVSALHLNLLVALPPSPEAFAEMSDEERARFTRFHQTDAGYFTLQETKPQTIAYSLNDSPVGLLAWHAEKFQSWTDHDGSFESAVSRDEFLTNLTIYWVTQTSGSSARIYREGLLAGGNFVQHPRFETPVGHAIFPKEVIESPRRWIDEAYNVVHRREMPRGGHFAALEQPELLVEDMREFFATLR